jgi:hypothetical protein
LTGAEVLRSGDKEAPISSLTLSVISDDYEEIKLILGEVAKYFPASKAAARLRRRDA